MKCHTKIGCSLRTSEKRMYKACVEGQPIALKPCRIVSGLRSPWIPLASSVLEGEGAHMAACDGRTAPSGPRSHSYGRLRAAVAAAVVVAVRRLLVFAPSFGVRQLVVFLPAHAPILEPHLHLPLGQAERVGHLHAPAAREVSAEVELLLELQNLLARVGRP